MLNAINTNQILQYQKVGQFNGLATKDKASTVDNPFASYAEQTLVDISEEGKNIFTQSQNDEQKLSVKAQSYLETLRKKYGDYDFVVSNDLDTAQTVGNSKEYSVIFTTDELEKMAEDEKYADKVMKNVGKATDILKNLSEKDLGEGVKFSQLSVSIDDEGNMKLFAQLEKLSEEQAERLENAKQKRVEENAAKKDIQATEEKQSDFTKIIFKSADVEADSEDELLHRIFGIDWSKIPDEEAYI